MALNDMQKVALVGLKSEQAILMDTLTKSRAFEPKETSVLEGTEKSVDFSSLDSILGKLARYFHAINLVTGGMTQLQKDKALSAKHQDVLSLSAGGNEFVWADLEAVLAEKEVLEAELKIIEELSYARNEIKSQRNKNKAMMKMLSIYLDCDDKFSAFTTTGKCGSMLVYGKMDNKLSCKLAEADCYVHRYVEGGVIAPYGLVYLLDNESVVRGIATESGLTICPYTYDNTPYRETRRLVAENKNLDKSEDDIVVQLASKVAIVGKLKLMYDSLVIESEKAKAELNCCNSEQTYVIEGWVPSGEVSGLEQAVAEKTTAYIATDDAKEEENPPTQYKGNAVLAPFQSLTDSYSPPKYGEFDPSLFTGFFFFLFFGMMTADAGYGLVLALGTFFMLKLTKPSPGFKNLVLLIGISSISAIVWGLLFGSVFGLDFSIYGGLFGLELPESIWFNPLTTDGGPMMLLVMSLIVGILHMFCGYAIKFYKLAKQGKIFDAICDGGFMMIVYIGVAMLVLWMSIEMLGVTLLPSGLSVLLMPGLITFGVGILGIVLTKGRKKPSVGGKIISGASGLYDIVNIMSDVLSYARIFCIALASCAIALAFNTLVELVAGGGVVGIMLAVVLAIVLHAFNLAMGVLSAYVHNARLQYLEFYGKFYDGGGRSFAPLGGKTKYIKVL